MDDDILVDFYQFLGKVNEEGSASNSAFGYKQIGLSPQRYPGTGKWAVSEEEFQGPEYPDFLSGWAYAIDPLAASKIVSLAERRSVFWIDDVWVTGILASEAGIRINSLNTFYTVYREYIDCCLEDEDLTCDFMVGPSERDEDLVRSFGLRATRCHRSGSCGRRTWEQSVIKTCIKVDNPLFLPDTPGIGEVFVINQEINKL